MKINIVYRQFFDMEGSELVIGGVETYIINLIRTFVSKYDVYVYQFANENFIKSYLGAVIVGVRPRISGRKLYKNPIEELTESSYTRSDVQNDILIFATDNDIIRTKYSKVIAIQHGVGWDVPILGKKYGMSQFKSKIADYIRPIKNWNNYRKCKKLVCVDYNFINWYRTCIRSEQVNYKVIPNFAHLPIYKKRESQDIVSIIFARRFHIYRGTRIFAEAITKILDDFTNINVVIAGEGPDEEYLHKKLERYSNVTFIKFSPLESVEIHKKYNIAVVPSIGSEGTSLSLLEAMAAGCAVICTDIGGLSNIVINGHNGLIVKPTSNELYIALKKLVSDVMLREKISKCAYETISDSFSYKEWSKKWIEVIEELEHS